MVPMMTEAVQMRASARIMVYIGGAMVSGAACYMRQIYWQGDLILLVNLSEPEMIWRMRRMTEGAGLL